MASARRVRSRAKTTIRYAGGDNLLYKTTLLTDIDDRSGRQEFEWEGWWSAMAQKAYSLSHTKWMCGYHIVFTPKYRRKIIYNQIRPDIGEILKRLCEYKGIEIIEGHLMPDHVHMLVAIPPPEDVRLERDGLLEGEELADDLRQACQPQVQVRQQEVLGGRLLRLDRGPERGHGREIHQGAGSPRHRAGQAEGERARGPV